MLIKGLILSMPFVSVCYFLRAGESSVYIFDIFFLLLLFAYISVHKISVFFLFLVSILTAILLFGLLGSMGIINYELSSFLSTYMRYVQMLIFFGMMLELSKKQTHHASLKKLHYCLMFSLSFPLAYCFLFMQLNPEHVLVSYRLAGYFSNPNYLSLFIVISIPIFNFSVSSIESISFARKLTLISIFYSLAGFCLFYSGSISGWILSFVAFVISYICVNKITFKSISPFILLSVGAAVLLPLLLQDYLVNTDLRAVKRSLNLLSYLLGQEDTIRYGSGNERQVLFNNGVDIISSSTNVFLFGVGLGQAPVVFYQKYGIYLAPHNSYLTLMIEIGAVGLFVIGLLLYRFISPCLKCKKLLSIFSGYILAMFATPHLYLPFFWVSIGVAFYIGLVEARQYSKSAK